MMISILNNWMKWLSLLVALLTLSACGGSSTATLPLAKDQPTFIFFYTDG